MRVLVIISRDLEKASTKYRLAQYESWLANQGVELEYVHRRDLAANWARVRAADLVLNQKVLFGPWTARRLLRASRRIIFDYDDAIYTRPERPYGIWTQWRVQRRFGFWVTRPNRVITANEYLAAAGRRCGGQPLVVPMALDLQVWRPQPKPVRNEVVIGWPGSPSTVPQLERIGPFLAEALRQLPQARLVVFGGKRPELPCPFQYHPFVPGQEARFVAGLDIGLLPLGRDEFSAGKSPIKALQYLACGVPIIGNAFGATREILQPSTGLAVDSAVEWVEALRQLVAQPGLRAGLGSAGRALMEQQHDAEKVGHQLVQFLRSVAP